jgi:small ligand-binding sensory domain FIST
VCTGAVGAFLRGPFTLTQITSTSYRPVGSPAVVTSAAGNLILGLDGEPVRDAFPRMYNQLGEGEKRAEVALGVEVTGSPGEWVTRGVSLTMGHDGQPLLAVAMSEVSIKQARVWRGP